MERQTQLLGAETQSHWNSEQEENTNSQSSLNLILYIYSIYSWNNHIHHNNLLKH